MHLFSVWIIGPSAVGKTTVSKIFYNQLKIKNDKLILLDGGPITFSFKSVKTSL